MGKAIPGSQAAYYVGGDKRNRSQSIHGGKLVEDEQGWWKREQNGLWWQDSPTVDVLSWGSRGAELPSKVVVKGCTEEVGAEWV